MPIQVATRVSGQVTGDGSDNCNLNTFRETHEPIMQTCFEGAPSLKFLWNKSRKLMRTRQRVLFQAEVD